MEGPIKDTVLHPVPRNTASWWYVFGSASFVLLLLQIVTGILLAIVYVPSAGEAWNSLQVLNQQLPLGWFLRAMHGWGSNFMVAVVLIHMCQVFLFGAYKFPRELTWILGVFLLLMTLGMAFTGQVMRFDQDAYWGLGIGASIVARVPFIGGPLVDLMLGGPIIAGPTLTRFFALHVFVIPGMMLAFAALHIWMVVGLGINDWPMPGRVVKRSTYIQEYHELTQKDGIPFVPGAVWKDMIFSAAILFAVALCAVFLGPFGPTGFPDPTIIQTVPKPDFFFLWLYTILSFPPGEPGDAVHLDCSSRRDTVPAGIAVLCRRRGEELAPAADRGAVDHRAGSRLCGVRTPGNLHPLESGDAGLEWRYRSRRYVHGATPLGRQGQIVFQDKQCRNCHMLGGVGGQRGPALDGVATRLTYDQLVRQVLQGGGNMPAYGKNLSPPEVTALVSFLETLHPEGQRSSP